ncbi:MAG TPA: glycosyltransferase [Thermoanaerobaculia bacterium]|nr:glycosyltransferase [Thermoanaerobaculia bacterium]
MIDHPFVSVVIETITREDYDARSLADHLQPLLDAILGQSYPREMIETLVVVDAALLGSESDEAVRRYPWVKIVSSPQRNYFAAKNAGVRASRGSIVALIDGDCVPARDWLEILIAPLRDDTISAVAGATRYAGTTLKARTFSVPDFANVVGDNSGAASGFNINNCAFRREVLLATPLDSRIRRDGGCFLLYHQLRAAGVRIVYEPLARVQHGLDIASKGFVRKHFNRGFDGVSVYRADDAAVLRGTRLFRRFGAVALVAFAGRRIAIDWLRLIRHRGQIGIPVIAIPYFAAVTVMVRLIGLTGGLVALARTGRAPMAATAPSR